MLKALYGMLIASLLYYKMFVRDIKSIGFELNPYDPCVANRTVNGKQHTITFHVDDIKSSHVDPKVNDEFKEVRPHRASRSIDVARVNLFQPPPSLTRRARLASRSEPRRNSRRSSRSS